MKIIGIDLVGAATHPGFKAMREEKINERTEQRGYKTNGSDKSAIAQITPQIQELVREVFTQSHNKRVLRIKYLDIKTGETRISYRELHSTIRSKKKNTFIKVRTSTKLKRSLNSAATDLVNFKELYNLKGRLYKQKVKQIRLVAIAIDWKADDSISHGFQPGFENCQYEILELNGKEVNCLTLTPKNVKTLSSRMPDFNFNMELFEKAVHEARHIIHTRQEKTRTQLIEN